MRYVQSKLDGDRRLLVAREGDVYDLTSAESDLGSFRDLVSVARAAKEDVDTIAERQMAAAAEVDHPETEQLTIPVVPDEVWAAGVTYEISEEARREESGMPELYLDVYEADRPEVFFKGTRRHVVEPGGRIGVRGDSEWDVPEPELGVILHHGEIIGYTVGNDVSSRSIEGKNPLYLPQAKVYDRSCSIGPAVVSTSTIDDPHDLELRMAITREDNTMYDGVTNTGNMVRTCEELVAAYRRHQAVPPYAVLLTGTSLVPPDEFTLHPGDTVRIEIDEIGVLENDVVAV